MIILALDCATRCGWAIGEAGQKPRSGAVRLKGPMDPPHKASTNLFHFIRDMRKVERFDMIVYEAPMDPHADFVRPQTSEAITMPWMFMGAVEILADAWDVPAFAANRQSTLKHFTGKARWGGRAQAKAAVISRCVMLGYLDKGCKDDDRADAIALHDYASARWGRTRPAELTMFGGVH
jgi:hypothetical protein